MAVQAFNPSNQEEEMRGTPVSSRTASSAKQIPGPCLKKINK